MVVVVGGGGGEGQMCIGTSKFVLQTTQGSLHLSSQEKEKKT